MPSRDKEFFAIWPAQKSQAAGVCSNFMRAKLSHSTSTLSKQGAVNRIRSALHVRSCYEPIQIDELLFTADEETANKQQRNPYDRRSARLAWLKSEADFGIPVYWYNYATTGAAGGWLHFMWTVPNRDDENTEQVINSRSLQVVTKLKAEGEVPIYLSRAVLKAPCAMPCTMPCAIECTMPCA